MRPFLALSFALASSLLASAPASAAVANPPAIYGPASFSPKTAPPSGAQGAQMRARRAAARTFVRGTPGPTGGVSRAQLRLLDHAERSPALWAASDLMEHEIEETEPMAVHAASPGVSVVTLREPDVDDSGPRFYGNGNYRQVRLAGYTGGAVELDVAMPVSGHHHVNDYRAYARTNTFGVKLTAPDGRTETFAGVPAMAFGASGPLGRGDYVTVMRLRLDGLGRGETKLEIWPEATSVRGYLNGRTLGILQ